MGKKEFCNIYILLDEKSYNLIWKVSARYVTVYTVPNNFTCKPEYIPNESYMINLNMSEQWKTR